MASKRPPHILLVEDDEATLEATTGMLERLGYIVSVETEGLAALRTFSEDPDRFDLAILDHGMAALTGLELAQRFRRIRPGFPCVIYTGYLEEPAAEQLKAAGVRVKVTKPATRKQLSKAIDEALGGRIKA